MSRDHSHDEKVALLRQLKQEKDLRKQQRRQVFWTRLPKFFIPGGIAFLIAGVLLALPAYQKMPDHRGLWTLFVFLSPGVVMLLIGLVVWIGTLVTGTTRKSKHIVPPKSSIPD